MPIYTKVNRKYTPGYARDNIFIKTNRVPYWVKEQLDAGVPKVEAPEVKEACLLCEDQVKRHRYLNMQAVGLCEYHYQNTSLGKIAQYMRENGLEVKPDVTPIKPPLPPKKIQKTKKEEKPHMAGALRPAYGQNIEV